MIQDLEDAAKEKKKPARLVGGWRGELIATDREQKKSANRTIAKLLLGKDESREP